MNMSEHIFYHEKITEVIFHYRKKTLFVGFFMFVGADVCISNYVHRF
jgi:hypothetical protein